LLIHGVPAVVDEQIECAAKLLHALFQLIAFGLVGNASLDAGILELLGIERTDVGEGYNLTDAGNGRRLVDKHRDEIRYCVDDQEFYIWDGVRWRKDVIKKIRELAKAIAADIRHEADSMKPPAATGDEDVDQEAIAEYETRKRNLLKWANQSENADRVSKTIISAESDPRITCFRCDFDRDSHLLNCPNCVVDLRTGTMMPHDRKFMMSNLCPTEFDPKATYPKWDESLAAFTRNHADLLPFLLENKKYGRVLL